MEGRSLPARLFRTLKIRAIIRNRMILRQWLGQVRGVSAALLLGLPGVALFVCPSSAVAQAIGTMQVTARVQPSPAAWPTLDATAELATRGAATGAAGRLDRGLARLELEPASTDPHLVRIRVDYLHN
jgi:hypothetical protein